MKPKREISLGFTEQRVPEGAHICYIYDDEVERERTVRQFLECGLRSREKVMCLVEEVSPEELRASLQGIDFPADALTVLESAQGYCPSGSFEGDRTLRMIREFYRQATDVEGYVGARVAGQMAWSLEGNRTTERDLIEYEARVNQVTRECAVSSICQYDAHRFNGRMIVDVLSIHPMMIIRGQLLNNPYYLEPEVFLAKLSART